MTVYLIKREGVVILVVRAEGDGAIGEMATEVHPGESALGKSYGEWRSLPEGPHEVTT